MEKLTIPDINLTSDSEDFIDDYWLTSPSASFDGSSVHSIPWAEDVVKQNQELWEKVERMFYGEESLPTNDIKLLNEIIEWTNHFPYLRITGKQMPIHFDCNVLTNDENYEELLDIHPSTYYERKSAVLYANRYDGRYRDDSLSGNGTLENDIEKCLRITSGPLLSRRAQNSRSTCPISRVETQAIQNHNKQNLKSALVSVRSNYDVRTQFAEKFYGSFVVDRLNSMPYSASFIKIPRLKSETGDLNKINTNKSNMIRRKTATLVPITRPLRNSITLPTINIESKYKQQTKNTFINECNKETV